MGSTSPKTTRRMVMAPMATARPAGPKRVAAMEAASAEAAMLARVMPTRMVTRRSWGRARSGWSRARPREKYAASAPVSSAETITSTIRLISSRTVRLGTEVFVTCLHAHRPARAIEEGHARRERLDLAHHGERGARGAAQAVPERRHGVGIAGEEELEVLAARGRPRESILTESARHLTGRRVHGQPLEGDPRSHAARPADVGEIGGEAVGAIHHGVHAARRAQPSSLGHPRGGAEMCGGDGLDRVRARCIESAPARLERG